MDSLHGETLTIQTRVAGPPDDDGEPTYTTTESTVDGCNVQPVLAEGDALFTQTTVVSRWKVNGPTGRFISGLITGDSIITWRGTDFKPNGAVQDFHTADHLGEHTELYILEA